MTASGPNIELAPAGVLRAAAWPLDCLDAFGHPELADIARTGAIGSQRLERAYAAAIEQERAALWARSLDDARFRCALTLASPSALQRSLDAAARRAGPRNRAMRLSEYTLYRYLARAAGRATPQGLWAGVGEVRPGAETGFSTAVPAAVFSPALRPFQTLLRGLAAQDDYQLSARWVLNPTLQPQKDGQIGFLHRRPGGGVELRRLDAPPAVVEALRLLRGRPPARLAALATEIAAAGAWPVGARRALLSMLRSLAAGGALLGGLDLPTQFATPWQALDRAAAGLQGGHARAWRDARDRLQALCGRLGELALDGDDRRLGQGLDAASACVRDLARRLQLDDPGTGRAPVECDLRLPWRLSLGPQQCLDLAGGLAEYDRNWLAGASPAAEHRRAQRRQLAQALGVMGLPLMQALQLWRDKGQPPPRVWPAPGAGQTALAAWAAALSTATDELVLDLRGSAERTPQAPLGCLFAGLDAGWAPELRSLADVPALAAARFAGVIDTAPLNAWLRERLDGEARRQGRRWLELQTPFEGNPNALAAALSLAGRVTPWSADPGALALHEARIRALDAEGELALDPGDGQAPVAVLTTRVADLAAGDPLSQLLLWTGGHESPGRYQRAVEVPLQSELERPRFTPRIRLPGGALLRERRSLLREALPALLRLRGARRFHAWQSLARDLEWPQQLQIAVGEGEPIRLHRDSPLAVEAVFKGLRADTPWVSVAAAAPMAGVTLPDGRRHVLELVLPFARRS